MISLKPNNTCNLTGHIGDRMPRRRKRHAHKMSLMLLIFVGCCSTLISSPLLAQAKESNNNATTSRGENMLSTDQHGDSNIAVLAQGEANDKTNDKNTFKRLKPTDFNDKDGVMVDVDEVEEERSSEVIEMIQPPHTLRHQEHYKQRILMAGKDFQQKQKHVEKQLDKNAMDDDEHNDGNGDDDDNDDYGDGDDEQQERELSVHNRNLRYQQIQLALREPLASPTPPHHHRRHEHHVSKQRLAKQTAFTWPQQQQQQQHHLRHQHHQHPESPQQPQLRHVKPEMRKQNLSTTNTKPLHQRYFDRESSYSNPLARMMTTEGPPHLRHTGSNKYWNTLTYSTNPHNRLYNDEANNKQMENAEEEEQEEDIKRFSLSLDEHENIDENKEKLTLAETAKVDDNDNYDVSANANDDDDDDSNDEDDYSYEDEDGKEINKKNKYPSLSTNTKTNVKRYTNPLRPLYKPSSPSLSSSYAYRSNHHLRHTPHNIKSSSNDNDNDDDYDDMVNYEDDTAAVAISSSVDESPNDDDKFSDEKWNKIEHEHYRKQLQHQRAMQALRSRRPSIDNTPHTATTTLHNNKYSSYTPAASLTPSLTYNAAWTKRQTINDDEGDNIYSRSYVPGTVTRKKEEELGSPTAILESRRQYALQQRQNKALASAHHRRIVTEGSCRLPQPRVERIRRDSWKIYTPHCTILHRCADDAGCCPSERQTCAPKRTKNVDLYFFVISLNETQGSIEKLTFVNHTECHCVQRSKQRAPEYASSGAKDLIANNQIPFLRRATVLNCHCPNLFEKILQEDGYCRCDCSSGNMGCDWLKRGMEHFSMNDRKCIIEGRCKLPTCEYGQYIKKHGRCPRREERHLSTDMDW